MRKFDQFRYKMLHRSIAKKISKFEITRNPVSLEEANNVGILFNATKVEFQETALYFIESLRKKRKKVEALAFINAKEKQEKDFDHFTLNEVDWKFKPDEKIAHINDFIHTPYQVLINLHPTTCLPLEYIAALSPAHLKVGAFNGTTNCYDMMIDCQSNIGAGQFIDQVKQVLASMKNHKYEPAIV